MDAWKRSFSEKLAQAQSRWATRLDEALDAAATPVFGELQEFLTNNGITPATPLREKGRRSYKFELAEDAYVLLLFRGRGVGEFELTRETFVLGQRPQVRKTTERLTVLTPEWVQQEFQAALDDFVDLLVEHEEEAPVEPTVELN